MVDRDRRLPIAVSLESPIADHDRLDRGFSKPQSPIANPIAVFKTAIKEGCLRVTER